jgi:hypothetical protein
MAKQKRKEKSSGKKSGYPASNPYRSAAATQQIGGQSNNNSVRDGGNTQSSFVSINTGAAKAGDSLTPFNFGESEIDRLEPLSNPINLIGP